MQDIVSPLPGISYALPVFESVRPERRICVLQICAVDVNVDADADDLTIWP